MIVNINLRHISETPAAVGIDHGPRSHPGIHQLLGVSLSFLAHQHLGKPRSTARSAFDIHPGLGLNGHEDGALRAGFPAPKRSRIQLTDTIAHLIAGISVLQGRPNLLERDPHSAIRCQPQMPLELLGRHPAFPLHDITQRVDPEQQRRLRGFEDRARAETQLLPTAFAGANFGPSRQGIPLLGMTTRAVKLLALETTAPQQGSSCGLFCSDFGEKAFSGKGFVGHQ